MKIALNDRLTKNFGFDCLVLWVSVDIITQEEKLKIPNGCDKWPFVNTWGINHGKKVKKKEKRKKGQENLSTFCTKQNIKATPRFFTFIFHELYFILLIQSYKYDISRIQLQFAANSNFLNFSLEYRQFRQTNETVSSNLASTVNMCHFRAKIVIL